MTSSPEERAKRRKDREETPFMAKMSRELRARDRKNAAPPQFFGRPKQRDDRTEKSKEFAKKWGI